MVCVILKKIFSHIENNNTLLGVGPMSKNCVDAVCEISDELNTPILIISSRRQIDSKHMDGGYVNNWNTEEYSKYVEWKSKKKMVALARDHGGPWQNEKEKKANLSQDKAMASAKESFKVDILNNFKILHIDPSESLNEKPTLDLVIDRIYELLEFCNEFAIKNHKEIIFEIGTEEQSGSTNTPEELEYTLSVVKKFCKKNKIRFPSFVVIQSGTKVAEMRNIGSFESIVRVKNELAPEIQIPQMIDICDKFEIYMKAHNSDYLSNESLRSFNKLGIHSINVAPEFGIVESQSLYKILKKYNLNEYADKFLKISYNSYKWKKWLAYQSKASDFEKSIISGHYIFSSLEFLELKKKIELELYKNNINLEDYLKNNVKKSILRYINNLQNI